jgi:hypothetical protein
MFMMLLSLFVAAGNVSALTLNQNSSLCTMAQGSPLNPATTAAVKKALSEVSTNKTCIAYSMDIKVGGSLAWRANNPGNLRSASTQIAKVPGAGGEFAIFATMQDGTDAQKDLYLRKYGDMTVSNAIAKLTPPSENNTPKYLEDLKKQGVDINGTVKSQIDKLVPAIQKNEGIVKGISVPRSPN